MESSLFRGIFFEEEFRGKIINSFVVWGGNGGNSKEENEKENNSR